jgi:cytochrome c553
MTCIKNNVAVWFALAVLLAVPSAFARSDNTDPLTGRDAIVDDSADAIRKRSGGGDHVAGKEKSLLCQGCHGEDGNSSDELTPKLAGQYDKYISKQLRNYQTGARTHQIMSAMAATISDSDLDNISSYFASQAKMKGGGLTTNERGKTIFLKGNISKMVVACVDCHGVSGKGLTSDAPLFPVIGGQHKAYLLKQLIDFRGDNRVNSPNAIMNKTLKSLSDEDLEALAEYISGL